MKGLNSKASIEIEIFPSYIFRECESLFFPPPSTPASEIDGDGDGWIFVFLRYRSNRLRIYHKPFTLCFDVEIENMLFTSVVGL